MSLHRAAFSLNPCHQNGLGQQEKAHSEKVSE